MEKIDNKMLPVPLKYTYPILMETKFIGNNGPSVFIPELGKWICNTNLIRVLNRYNISIRLWRLRWIYKIDGKTLANRNLLANKIIDIYYRNKPQNTKKYIKIKLLDDINYEPDFFCLKSDIIDLIFNNNLNSIYMSWYDFSLVPQFIKTGHSSFEIIVKEKDITGKSIENWKVNFYGLSRGSDSFKVRHHKECIIMMLKNSSVFKKSATNRYNDAVDYSQVEYKGSDYPVKLICKICGTVYYQTPEVHLISSINTHGCPNCFKKYYHNLFSNTFDDFVNKAKKVHGNRYLYFKEYFVDYNTPTRIYDTIKKEYFQQIPKKHLMGHGNNTVQNSMGENLIKTWLRDNKLKFNSSVIVKDLIHGRNINRVIIDFVVYLESNTTIWIEYNGIQHYKEMEFFCHGNMTFEKQLQRDKNVREYCKNNHIQLIEIPYTYKNYESVKDLLDRVILNGEDINSIIDYNSLYNN